MRSSSESAEPRVRPFSFATLQEPAGGSVREVSDVLAAALAEADGIREAARREGHAEGRAAGMAEARAEAQAGLDALRAALEAVERLREEMAGALERDAVLLGLRLAEQIVAGALAVQPERVVDVARLALRHLVDRRRVTLIVNPADLELVSGAVGGLQAELGGIQHCDVQADRRVARGGAVARTEAGEIDLTIATQLARAREVVAAELSPSQEGAPPHVLAADLPAAA